jgi:zinc-ribbon domain
VATDAKKSGEDVPTAGVSGVLPTAPMRARERNSLRPPELGMLHRKAHTALGQALDADEEPRLVIPGLAASAIIATDRRAFVFKVGPRAGLPFGARLKAFEYESVMRVDLRPAGELDVVVIHAPLKISTCSSYWADARDDPWRARNAIAVTRGSHMAEQAASELSKLARDFNTHRGAARRPEHARSSSGDHTPDVVGRIAELEQRGSRPEIAPAGEQCPACGNELGSGWQFCPRCGAPARDAPSRPAKAGAPAKGELRGRSSERRRRY